MVNLKSPILPDQKENREAELAGNIKALTEENIALKKEIESCRQASERLDVNYHHLSEAMDGMKDAALIVDGEGKITYLNKEAKALFQDARGDLAGNQLADLPFLLDDKKFREKYYGALSDRNETRFLMLFWQNSHWYEVFLHPHDRDMLVYFRDVTLQHTTEELYKLTHFSITTSWTRLSGSGRADISSM